MEQSSDQSLTTPMKVALGVMVIFIVLYVWRPQGVLKPQESKEVVTREINWNAFILTWIFYSLLAAVLAMLAFRSSGDTYSYFTE